MASSYHPVSCFRANLRSAAIALALVTAWFATTSNFLFAKKIENPFARTTQQSPPSQADEAWVSDNSRTHFHIQRKTLWRASLVNHFDTEQTVEQDQLPAPPANPFTSKQLESDQQEVVAVPSQIQASQSSSQPTDCFAAAPMSTISVDVSLPAGTLPEDFATRCTKTNLPKNDLRLHGGWASFEQHWSATCQRHRPLYFEEINAERYGYTSAYCLQPFISAGHFFLTIPALPYKMAVDCPRECEYTLGRYRPGSCVPWRINHLPCRTKATIAEVATIAGLILLIP